MNAVGIIIFSGSLKIECLEKLVSKSKEWNKTVFLTSHRLFQNEREYLNMIYGRTEYLDYGTMLTDSENEECDLLAYKKNDKGLGNYYHLIDTEKNKKILSKIKDLYQEYKGYIFSDDLGIIKSVWEEDGFTSLGGEYYTDSQDVGKESVKAKEKTFTKDVYVYSTEDKKYVFIGGIKRIAGRMNIIPEYSEEERNKLINREFEPKEKCQYLTTVHEYYKCNVPNSDDYDVRIIADGFFPSNWTSKDLMYYHDQYNFYVFDNLAKKGLEVYGRSVSWFPFVRKQYMPDALFRKELKCVLFLLNCAGSWTAQINRSDSDILVETIVSLAKEYPNIKFICRCHPAAVVKAHEGINAINRVRDYIEYVNLNNLQVSAYLDLLGSNSLESDLNMADLVIGEYSNTLIEAALKGIPFVSVNLTKRRDLFKSMTDLGFPHCENLEDLKLALETYSHATNREQYRQAINNYNNFIFKDM